MKNINIESDHVQNVLHVLIFSKNIDKPSFFFNTLVRLPPSVSLCDLC